MSAADEDYAKGVDKMLELATKHGIKASPDELRQAFDMGANWGVVCLINEMERAGFSPTAIHLMRAAAAAGVKDR